ncbi:MAG TPA: hypothetical protein VK438_17385 [Xanthobacteraceae bacterium]|nr:hypothetical protein [Xanthobacteraceae bacterium]
MSADGAPDGQAPPAPARDVWLLALIAEAALLLAALAVTGALSGVLSPDTSSYFGAAASPSPWGQPRNPIYGYLAGLLGGSATTTGAVALAQALLHAASVFVLYGGARRAGIGGLGAFAFASAALLAQSDLYHLRILAPEAPANACLLAGLGLTLAATRSVRALGRLIVPIALVTGAGYVLRPTQLPAILILPALYFLFAWRQRRDRRLLPPLALMLALAVPFLVQSGVRLRAVGDFNIVSFGGYQMSGLAAFMLDPVLIARLPEDVRPFAQAVLERRQQQEAAGTVPAAPLNSAGERSFVSTALGYFDIYARGYDNVLVNVIVPLLRGDDSWVVSNRKLTTFALATVRAAPLRYLAWVGGATARLVGHALATNAPMLVATALWLVTLLFAFLCGRDGAHAEVGAVSLLALAWFACNGALPVLITFPAARYIDSAAALLPAIPLTRALALAIGCRAGAFDSSFRSS